MMLSFLTGIVFGSVCVVALILGYTLAKLLGDGG